jgi:glycerate 2-kinase
MVRDLSSMKKDAIDIFGAALSAVDPRIALRSFVTVRRNTMQVGGRRYDLSQIGHIYVVGAGKANGAMAEAVEDLLVERITEGAITVKYGHLKKLRKIKTTEAGHPVPDKEGIAGTHKIVDLLTRANERDLVISLISGGGSALMPLPVEGISLADKRKVTDLLLKCGATIEELNAMRKHLSRIKGGQMARLAFPATVVNLMLSDVIGDAVDVIASGPSVPDMSTFRDCDCIIEKYRLSEKLPRSVADHIRQGVSGTVSETPKPGDPVFDRVQNVVIANNSLAVKGAGKRARQLGYRTLVLSTSITGETREVAHVHGAIAREIHASAHPIKAPACILSGGETTVTIRGSGLGGRNQEFALATALDIHELDQTVVLSGGTDGTDGPTDAAGAFADSTTVARAKHMGLDPHNYLNRNDSYHFFHRLGDLLITGPTHTNVMDVRIILADKVTLPPRHKDGLEETGRASEKKGVTIS